MGRLKSADAGAGTQGIPVVVVIAVGLALVVTAGFLGLTLTADQALERFTPSGRVAEIAQATAVGPGTEILFRGISRPPVPSESPPAVRSASGPTFSGAVDEGLASAGIAILGLVAAAQAVAPAELLGIQASGPAAVPSVESGELEVRGGSPVKKKKRAVSSDDPDPMVSASGGPSSEVVDEGNDRKRGNGHSSGHLNNHDGNSPGNR